MAEIELENKLIADAKAKVEAEARILLENQLKAKKAQEDAISAAELKAKQEADARAKAATKKTTITCAKGKLTKKVTAVKPVCPVGYKKKV